MNSGRFVSFEGGEGAGKSTQARLLAEALRRAGIDTVLTREPGGTPGAEAIRNLLLDPPGEGWLSRAEALLFAAARADHVARVIRPALSTGQWVVCDRFLDSSRAYQGGAGGLEDAELMELHRIGSDGTMPDLTILIEIEPVEAGRRLARRDGAVHDAIGGRGADYHRRVAEAFARMATAEPERIHRISGQGSQEQTAAMVWAAVAPLLPL